MYWPQNPGAPHKRGSREPTNNRRCCKHRQHGLRQHLDQPGKSNTRIGPLVNYLSHADAADAPKRTGRMRGHPGSDQTGSRGRHPASRGAVMAAPLLRLAAGECQEGRSGGWRCGARDLDPHLHAYRSLGSRKSAEAGCRRPMPHSAAEQLERRKGPSRSVHAARQTSRLKPRTSRPARGRVIAFRPTFHLFVRTRINQISVEKSLKNRHSVDKL
jgi:hypothetical protein